jgi:hypothetical protein
MSCKLDRSAWDNTPSLAAWTVTDAYNKFFIIFTSGARNRRWGKRAAFRQSSCWTVRQVTVAAVFCHSTKFSSGRTEYFVGEHPFSGLFQVRPWKRVKYEQHETRVWYVIQIRAMFIAQTGTLKFLFSHSHRYKVKELD